MRTSAARALSFVVLFAVADCAEPPTFTSTEVASPVSETPPPSATTPSQALVSLSCSATIATRVVQCGTPAIGANGDVIVGGQNVYVKLTSSNIVVSPTDCPNASVPDVTMGCFSFNVVVQSLIPQAMGTTNAATLAPDANGVRVFFVSQPTPTGPGTMVVANPSGVATFTASGQPYYQYANMLQQNNTTASQNWQFQLTSDVTTFHFQVYVSAAVPYPLGYVDGLSRLITLNPGETITVPGTVRNYVGVAQSGQAITTTSANTGIVSSGVTQVTAGAAKGSTTVTFASGARPGTQGAAVAVCPAEVVSDGSNLIRSIANTDCFSAFHARQAFLPGTSYKGDLYRVTLTAGQTITVTLDTNSSGLDTWVVLADPLGNAVVNNDDDDVGNLGLGSHIDYTATVSGVYVILATTYSTGGRGAYTIGVVIQ